MDERRRVKADKGRRVSAGQSKWGSRQDTAREERIPPPVKSSWFQKTQRRNTADKENGEDRMDLEEEWKGSDKLAS